MGEVKRSPADRPHLDCAPNSCSNKPEAGTSNHVEDSLSMNMGGPKAPSSPSGTLSGSVSVCTHSLVIR